MRRVLTVAASAVALVVVGGVAVASIPGPDGVIHGCRKSSDGSVRVVDSAAACPSGYVALNWSQTGPQGPPGPAGAQGPAGAAAVTPSGVVSNPHTVSYSYDIPGDQSLWHVTAQCTQPGEVALGISGRAIYSGTDPAGSSHNFYQPLSFDQVSPQQYFVYSENDHPANGRVDLICATVGS